MAKFSVCRIYKVTFWLNFSYNYSVNLLQILHLYIHPSVECRRYEVQSMYGVTSCHAYVTSRCLRSSDAGWLACGLAKEKRITWLPHEGNAFFAFLNLLAWLYALLSALRIKIFKILWCSNKRVILSMKSVSLKFFDRETSWSTFLESPGNFSGREN